MLNPTPIFILPLTRSERKQKEELMEKFKAKYMRGVWYLFMFCVANADKNRISILRTISIIHFCFMHYCREIYCMKCRLHASEFIDRNRIIDTIYNCKTDDEMMYYYFDWFYRFKDSVNIRRGIKSAPAEEVLKQLLGLSSEINSHDYDYEKIENGIWHIFFMLVTKCCDQEHVETVYTFIKIGFNCFPEKQRNLFLDFCKLHNFEEAIDSDELIEYKCICFFDWIYSLYKYINTNSDIRIFSKIVVKESYYNISFCTEDCDVS